MRYRAEAIIKATRAVRYRQPQTRRGNRHQVLNGELLSGALNSGIKLEWACGMFDVLEVVGVFHLSACSKRLDHDNFDSGGGSRSRDRKAQHISCADA